MPTTHFVKYWKEVSWSPLAKEPGRAAWQHDTGVQNLADVNLTLRDVLERSAVESAVWEASRITRRARGHGRNAKISRITPL